MTNFRGILGQSWNSEFHKVKLLKCGIIMGVTRLLLLRPFYTIQIKFYVLAHNCTLAFPKSFPLLLPNKQNHWVKWLQSIIKRIVLFWYFKTKLVSNLFWVRIFHFKNWNFEFCKVRTFLETHKIWNNLPHGFDKSADLLSKRQNHEEDFFKLCVLLKKSEL